MGDHFYYMGEAERYQDYRKVKRNRFLLGQDNNALMSLFVLNVIFFLILLTMQVGYSFYEHSAASFYTDVVPWFELPASITKLSERPWTILTFMFSDVGVSLMRILSNMLWLWAFGFILQELAGNDKLIPIYIYGGLAGALAFVLATHFIPSLVPVINQSALLGANASVMAVAMATTTLSPNYRFFTQIRGGIPIWVLMAVYLIIDYAGVANNTSAHNIAHLGGALAGFIFVVLMRKGIDGSV